MKLHSIIQNFSRFCTVSGKKAIFSHGSCLRGGHNLKAFRKDILPGYLCFVSVSTIPHNTLSEKTVTNFLDHATKVYIGREKNKSNIKEVLEISEVEVLIKERLKIKENIDSLEELVKSDKEMKLLAKEEFETYIKSLNDLDKRLLEEISNNIGREYCENVILEVSAGVGGQEAMLFANDLLEMYCNYVTYLGYTYILTEKDFSQQGGIRHGSLIISGRGAYEKLRHEGGVHRVQRIPTTDNSNRIHTSVVSVAVFPQPSDIEVSLVDKDIKVETKRSSGAGGQSVNTTDSAVRIVHIPTGIAVECQTERSQIANKSIALIKLRTKIYENILNEQTSNTEELRRKHIGFKNRNEKIRTYQFLQDRVTDHRLQDGTMHDLTRFMKGGAGLEQLQEKLQNQYQRKVLVETVKQFVEIEK